ncbi:MAG: LicD family protein [Clostridia bacterium]|nr:LicD family protein [Clostridia bacterium]
MEKEQAVRDVQMKILEIMKYIDKVCRQNDITYFIMGGTALGAVRHGGFIPWDDDLDIFMTPDQYEKFKGALDKEKNETFVLQEWRTTPDYLEYAKVRMNGTTFIEKSMLGRKDLHLGIYVDIMILHKLPEGKQNIQKRIYNMSKYVVLFALIQRGWKPKNIKQEILARIMKLLPNKILLRKFYKNIYKYDNLTEDYVWSYYITKAKLSQGVFERECFEKPADIQFEDCMLMGPQNIKNYLSGRYGNYMKLPSKEQQKADVHAYIYDCCKDYREYTKEW